MESDINFSTIEVGHKVGLYQANSWGGKCRIGKVVRKTKTTILVDVGRENPERYSLRTGYEMGSSDYRVPQLVDPVWAQEILDEKENELQAQRMRRQLDIDGRIQKLLKRKLTEDQYVAVGIALKKLEDKFSK